jgi:hypothetical protein
LGGAIAERGLLEFTLADGTPVYVEGTGARAQGDFQRVSRGGEGPPAAEAGGRFEEALARVRPATQAVLTSLKDLNQPEEISLEFGLKLHAKTGAVFASVDSEATFKLSITWCSPGLD